MFSEFLRPMALCQGLSSTHLQVLSEKLHHRHYVRDQELLVCGARSQRVCILVSGSCKVTVRRADGAQILLTVLGPGEIVGEMSALDGLPHSASIVALEPNRCLEITEEEFRECVDTMPVLCRNLLGVMIQRMRRITGHTEAMATLDVSGRLAYHITLFSYQYGICRDDGSIEIPLRLTQQMLAQMVGSTREWVNKSLAYYKTQRILSTTPGGRITVHNIKLLSKKCPQVGSLNPALFRSRTDTSQLLGQVPGP